MSDSSINAIWVDPLAFDALENGPPYLPERKRVMTANVSDSNMQALVERFDAPMAELGVLAAMLRAGAMIHQTHHWQTRGNSFYGDHLLFDRLYNDSQGLVDAVAERAVGSGSRKLVCPKLQAELLEICVRDWCGALATVRPDEPSPDEMVALSLSMERGILEGIRVARERLEQSGLLSNGTDNLLQGVADKHEEFTYLLQQRLEVKIASYDRRR